MLLATVSLPLPDPDVLYDDIHSTLWPEVIAFVTAILSILLLVALTRAFGSRL